MAGLFARFWTAPLNSGGMSPQSLQFDYLCIGCVVSAFDLLGIRFTFNHKFYHEADKL